MAIKITIIFAAFMLLLLQRMTGKFFFTLSLLLLSFVSIYSSFQKNKENYIEKKGYKWEQYDPSYFSKYQSVQDIIDTANNHFGKDKQHSIQYFNFIADILKKRFYHGFSTYSASENYLAAYSGKLIWDHLACIVYADDILKHPMAACSQQAIVFAEVLKACKVNYRKIAFQSHFCIEAFIEGDWRYFDTNMEPKFTKRQPLDTIVKDHRFTAVYSHIANNEKFKKGAANYTKGKINEEFAPNAKLFHTITRFLSSPFIPLSLLALFLIVQFRLGILGFKARKKVWHNTEESFFRLIKIR